MRPEARLLRGNLACLRVNEGRCINHHYAWSWRRHSGH